MSDHADKLSAQGPTLASRAERQVQFISAALRAGERAILVSGRDPFSTRVPDAALAACVSTSVRVLHIGLPLPERLELQEMIGAAAGIAGSREMAPQAMARQLLTADPRRAVVLAVDHADILPRQSLQYLALMADLLAMEWPALQIVFAAGPALLDRLSHPDFETFRNRITFASEVTEPSLERVQQEWEPVFYSDTRQNKDLCQDDDSEKNRLALARGSTRSIAPRSVQLPPLPTAPRRPGRLFAGIAAAPGARAALVLAMSCLVAIGYLAFRALSDDPTSPGPSVKSGALQKFATAPGPSPSAPPLDPLQADEVIASLIDRLETTIAQGSLGAGPEENQVATLCKRITELRTNASLDGLKMVITMPDRFAATATAAAAAGRFEEARRLEPYSYFRCNSAPTAAAGFAGTNPDGAPFQQGETALAQAFPPTAAGQPGAAGENDQPISYPKLAAPADPDAVPDESVDVTQRAQLAMVPDGTAAPVAAGLPAFAPIRVVLTFPRDDAAPRFERMAAIRQVLRAAEVEVADLVAVDAQHPRPGIGYYFLSDRDAARGVGRRLEPLLGAVEPVVLQLRGRVPSPGTIEIAVP